VMNSRRLTSTRFLGARQFLSPAVTAFATFALIGFYAALIPNFMISSLISGHHARRWSCECPHPTGAAASTM
jgi:hypothetical protein